LIVSFVCGGQTFPFHYILRWLWLSGDSKSYFSSRLALFGDASLDILTADQLTASFNLIDLSCNFSFDILAVDRLAASFNFIDLSWDVSFEIRRFMASFEQFPELFVVLFTS
jgi:hypothetical protein